MTVVSLTCTLFLLFSANLWRAASSQDINGLTVRFAELLEASEGVEDLEDFEREDVEEALESIGELWTVHVPNLLQDWQALANSHSLSEGCWNASIEIYRYGGKTIPLPFPNTSLILPGPGVLPLVDAAGKQGAGLLDGNFIMDGAYDECFNYNYTAFCLADPVNMISNNITEKISLLKKFGWSIGLCVPKQCNSSDVGFILRSTRLLDVNDASVLCTKTKTNHYNAGAIVMLIVTLVFLVLVVIGSLVDVIMMNLTTARTLEDDIPIAINNSPAFSASSVDTGKEGGEKMPLLPMKQEKSQPKVKPIDFIVAFSLFKTVPTLLATKQNASVITSLNGLRVISMFWVIVGHTFFWLFQPDKVRVDNLLQIRVLLERFSFQVINPGAFFAVDSFFFLGGVLVAYIVLRQMQNKGGRFPYVKYYVHRYLRLTPSYGFVLFFAWFLTPYLSYGPRITLHNPYASRCESYWWTNFLYINNLYPWKLTDACVGWSWYLANDMQFYVISPLLLITAYKMLPISIVLSSGLMACGFLVTATLTGAYDFQSNVFSEFAYNYTGKPDAPTNYQDAIYIKPWGRIAPYIVGLALGYILFKQYKIKFRRKTVTIALYTSMWAVATFLAFWLVYGLYFTWHGHVPTTAENVIYITFGRVLWSLCMAVVVFSCHNGYGWFINSFLSMKLWTPLARMTYNAYLVHPVVMTVVYGQLQTAFHYTDVSIATYAVAFVVLAYAVAAGICIVVELPLGTIEMKLFDLFGSLRRGSLRHNKKDFDQSKKYLPNPTRS